MSNYPETVQLGILQSGDIYIAEIDHRSGSYPPRYNLLKLSPGASPYRINAGRLEHLQIQVSRLHKEEQVSLAARLPAFKEQRIGATPTIRIARARIYKIIFVGAAIAYFLFHKKF